MSTDNRPIGVLDSGLGGISVLRELVKLMPGEDFIYYGDSANAPYGTRTPEEVIDLTKKDVEFLLERGAKAIVVACNTATSVAIKELRAAYEEVLPVIGIEPALKPAVKAKELLVKLAEYKPLAKIEELEEQNYNMIDERLNNGVEKFNREEEKKEQQEKPEVRSSLKERLAAKQKEAAWGNNKDTKEQDKLKKSYREM